MIITVINSSRFGEIEVSDDKIIFFEQGLPGLEHLKRYVFLTPESTYPLFFLQSIDDYGISLPVINPFEFIHDYNPAVNDSVINSIDLNDINDLLLLNVVVVPSQINKMTANMAAPILINVKALKGRQVVLDNNQYPIRYPVYEIFLKLRNGGVDNACSVQKEE